MLVIVRLFLSVLYAFEYGNQQVHYRHLMLFFYRKGKHPTQTANKIYTVYGEGAVVKELCRSGLLGLKLVISTLKIKNTR